MDDAGEMSSWYVFNAIGIYPFSPADDTYIVSVPIFDQVTVTLDNNIRFSIRKENKGKKITRILYGEKPLNGWFIPHSELIKGQTLVVTTQ
jgi:putative alpha-1,2-mannosidase